MLGCPEVVCTNELAVAHPAIFPFHATEIVEAEWNDGLKVIHIAQNLIQHYPNRVAKWAREWGTPLVELFSDLAQQLDLDHVPKQLWKKHEREVFKEYCSTHMHTHTTLPSAAVGALP